MKKFLKKIPALVVALTFSIGSAALAYNTDLAAGTKIGGYPVASTNNTLGDFHSTTSAQLGAVISDKTGTGTAVFNNGPTLNNPTITGSITGNITGNASTATALQTGRNINGVLFNGTADVTVPAAAGTLTGSTLASGVTASSLTSVGTLGSLTVTNPINGSVTGNAATATLAAQATAMSTAGTTTTVLHGNASGAPTYGAVALGSDVSGALPVANGGTGQTTANAGLNALLPTQTGNSGKVLQTDGSNTSWQTASGGTVTSVGVSGGTTGLTTSGGPVTGSGTITLGGTLARANGGTGTTTPGFIYTTMSASNTPAQNMTAFASDMATASASGLTLRIPNVSGGYKWGTSSQTSIALGTTAKVNIQCDPGATFLVESGFTTIPALLTTEANWTDYAVTGVNTVTSGGNISSNTEVTKITLSSSPAAGIVPGEMVSVYSNDLLPYNDGGSANFAHEIATVLSVSGNDIYLDRKLNRTYTVANTVKLRWYNNTGVSVRMEGCTWDADGDVTNPAITSRPAEVIEFRGIRNLHVRNLYKALWAGGTRYNSTMDADIQNDGSYLVNNGLSGISVYGYIEDLDGVNRTAKVRGGIYERGRHITSTWNEQNALNFSGTPTVGASTVFTYAADSQSSSSNVAVNDQLLIVGVSGTLGTAINNTWQTVTAKTGSISTGGTVTVSFNSTGLSGSAAGATGQIWDPTQVYRYGEDDGREMVDVTCLGSLGDCDDEHNGSINKRTNGLTARYPVEYTWSNVNPRAWQIRGLGTMIENVYQERGNQAVNFFSASQNHGLPNFPYMSNVHLRDQQNRTSAAAYFLTTGNPLVTDQRVWTLNNVLVDGGAYRVFSQAANSGNMLVNNFMFQGDWGLSGTSSQYIADTSGGDMTFKGGVIDLSNVTTNTEVRVAQTKGGRLIFDGVYLKGTCATSNYPLSINTAAGEIDVRNSVIEFPSSATNGTCRFIQVNNVAGTVNLQNNIIVNAAKLDTTRGLVNSSGASAVATVTMSGIMADATITRTSTSSGGTVTTATGSETIQTNVRMVPGGAYRTGKTAGDTALLQAYDTNGAAYTTFGTLTANNPPTFDLAAATTKGGSGIATASNDLSFFSATTSAQLAGVISDETGSGALCFANSPSLTSPSFSTIINTGTLSLPTSTDTLIGRATTDTLTNKTFDTAGTGNSFKINGTAITGVSGTGNVALTTSPSFTTPTLGAATATSINGLTLTSSTGALTITNGKTLSANNTLTFAGTDGSTLNVGTGGTLGTAAFTASSAYEVPLTFSTGLTRTTNTITVNPTQNITNLSNLTSNGIVSTSNSDGTLGITATTGSGNVVLATSPTLTTPTIGAATATSVNKVAITAPATSATLTLANGSTLATSGANSLTLTTTGTSNVTVPTSGTLLANSNNLSDVSSASTARTNLGFSALSALPIMNIPFQWTSSSSLTWSAIPNAETILAGASRIVKHIDMTNVTACRINVYTGTTAPPANWKIRAVYATNYYGATVANYSDLGSTELSITNASWSTNTYYSSSWINIAAGAKGDYYMGLTGQAGDGTTNAVFNSIDVQCR